ncbi:MAG: hypothetical protein ACLT9S_12210 [Faecalibacterium sp.]
MLFAAVISAVYGRADHGFSFVHHLFHAGPGGRCTAGCRFAACGLRRCATRPGGGIVALSDVMFLPPP